MAFRIYTKTGDQGETGLFGGKRIPKDDLRIEAYGTVDEFNAIIGMLSDAIRNQDLILLLRDIQHDLFVIGSHLAAEPGKSLTLPALPLDRITVMEEKMDLWDTDLTPLKNFILPGGHPAVSLTHFARSVCRRAERRVIGLSRREAVDPFIVVYLNRLSDLLFMLGRKLAHDLGVEEIKWEPRS